MQLTRRADHSRATDSESVALSERKPPTQGDTYSPEKSVDGVVDALRSLKEAGNATTLFPRANEGALQLVSVLLVLGQLT